jgi:multisubunit Na+/H+ antiporter MnhB subunit
MSIYREKKRRAKRREKLEGVVLILLVLAVAFFLMATMDTSKQNKAWCDYQRELVRTSPMEWGEGFQELCGDYKVK